MQKLILLLCLSLLFNFTYAQNNDDISIERHRRDSILISENTSFQTSEYLKYDAKYGIVKGAEIKLITGVEEIGDSYFYVYKAIAKNAGLAGNFFDMLDIYESYANIITGLPIRATRNIRENSYTKYNELLFDRKKNEIISTNQGVVKASKDIVDLLSGFYYARRFLLNDLKAEQKIIINMYFEEKFFSLKLRYKKTENIRTDFGKISCIKLVPVIEPNGTFKSEKDLEIWLTNDDAHIPVKVNAQLPVGSAKANLVDFRNIVPNCVLNKDKKEKNEKTE